MMQILKAIVHEPGGKTVWKRYENVSKMVQIMTMCYGEVLCMMMMYDKYDD